jgi:hypothetical protein
MQIRSVEDFPAGVFTRQSWSEVWTALDESDTGVLEVDFGDDEETAHKLRNAANGRKHSGGNVARVSVSGAVVTILRQD